MGAFYHIKLTTRDNQDYYEFDVTDEHINDIVEPFKNRQRFLFGHQFLDSNKIKSIWIITTSDSYRDYWYHEKEDAATTFEIMSTHGIDITREFISPASPKLEEQIDEIRKSIRNAGKKVFVVHGHDKSAYLELARLLEQWGLQPIILHEKPEGGRTIIEKFEDHASEAGYAFILLTPDDVGGKDGDSLKPRARQNVIFELGFFIGKLGHERVCVLNKGVEFPSDIHGFAYVEFNKSVEECYAKIRRELVNAGYSLKETT